MQALRLSLILLSSIGILGAQDPKKDEPKEGEGPTKVAGEVQTTEERPSEVSAEDWWSTARPGVDPGRASASLS